MTVLRVERFPVRVAEGERAAWFRDTYDDRRGGGTRPHHGVDIMAHTGALVVAPVSGVIMRPHVTDEGRTGYGTNIIQRTPSGTLAWHFAHFAHPPPGREGDRVNAGDVLGFVGATGNATTPHLHMQVERLPTRERIDPHAALLEAADRDDARVRYQLPSGEWASFPDSSGAPRLTQSAPSQPQNRTRHSGAALAIIVAVWLTSRDR